MDPYVIVPWSPHPVPPRKGTSEFWSYVGNNTGNLLFMSAATKLVDLSVHSLPGTADLRFRKENVLGASALLHPCANLLRPASAYTQSSELRSLTRWMTSLAETLRDWNVPMIVTSMGLEGDAEMTLDDEQVRLLRALSLVPVRGRQTARLVSRHCPEVEVAVLGCPSLVATGPQARRLREPPTRKLGICLPPNLSGVPQLAKRLGELCLAGGVVVAQTPEDVDFAKRHNAEVLLFESVEEWLGELPGLVSAVLSCRIHGSVAALCCGVPALSVSTSARVAELLDVSRLPQTEDVPRGSLEEILGVVEQTWEAQRRGVEDCRRRLASEWCLLLRRRGLPPARALVELSVESSPRTPLQDLQQLWQAMRGEERPPNDFGLAMWARNLSRCRALLPDGFCSERYARLNEDLRKMRRDELLVHYALHGEAEGRRWA